MNTATTQAEHTAPSSESLQPRPDQPERWLAHDRPVPFQLAAAHILEAHHDDGKRDDVVAHQLRTWAFGSRDGRTMELTRVPFDGRPQHEPLPIRELAFGQLCAKINAPAHYVRSLPMRLQVACMNWGMVQHGSSALLRLAGNEVRAIVSDRYAAADDALLLELIAETLNRSGYRDDAQVRAVAVGPHTLLRITLPGEGTPVKVGDIVEHGIDIGNSELGLRSVQVTPITYRLACTNGMRAWHSQAAVRVRHIGDPQRLRHELRDAIPVAFAEARGDIDRWKRAVNLLVESALDDVESLRRYGLNNSEVQAIGGTFARERGVPADSSADSLSTVLKTRSTAFEIANAITATARDRKSVPARLSLEEAAHRYLSTAT
jgi:hypothetical protein